MQLPAKKPSRLPKHKIQTFERNSTSSTHPTLPPTTCPRSIGADVNELLHRPKTLQHPKHRQATGGHSLRAPSRQKGCSAPLKGHQARDQPQRTDKQPNHNRCVLAEPPKHRYTNARPQQQQLNQDKSGQRACSQHATMLASELNPTVAENTGLRRRVTCAGRNKPTA